MNLKYKTTRTVSGLGLVLTGLTGERIELVGTQVPRGERWHVNNWYFQNFAVSSKDITVQVSKQSDLTIPTMTLLFGNVISDQPYFPGFLEFDSIMVLPDLWTNHLPFFMEEGQVAFVLLRETGAFPLTDPYRINLDVGVIEKDGK